MKAGIDYTGVCTPFFCHDGEGNLLVHKRSNECRDEKGVWDTGGGKLDFGLSPEENVLKEVAEEYGCTGTIDKALAPYSIIREHEGKKTHWIAIPFIIRVNKDEVKNNEPHKIDSIDWRTITTLPTPIHPGVTRVLERDQEVIKQHIND